MAEVVQYEVQAKLQDAIKQTDKFEKAVKELGDQGTKTSGKFAKLEKNAGSLGNKFSAIAKSAGSIAKGVGVASVAVLGLGTALFAIAKSTANFGDELQKASIRTGVAVETLSLLKATAEENDATFAQVSTSLKFLNKGIDEFKLGAGPGAIAFERLGITAEDFKKAGGDITGILPVLIDRIGNLGSQSAKTRILMDLFGRSGVDLIPTIQALADNGDELAKRFEKAGLIVGKQFADDSARFNDSIKRVQDSLSGLKTTIGADLLPVFADMLEDLSDWIADNRTIVAQKVQDTFTKIADALPKLANFAGQTAEAVGRLVGAFEEVNAKGQPVADFLNDIQSKLNDPKLGEFIRENFLGGFNFKEKFFPTEEIDELGSTALFTAGSIGQLGSQLTDLDGNMQLVAKSTKEVEKENKNLKDLYPPLTTKTKAQKTELEKLNEAITKENEKLIEQNRLVALEGETRIKVESAILREKGVKEDLVQINQDLKLEQIEINKRMEDFSDLIDKFPLVRFNQNLDTTFEKLSKIESIEFKNIGGLVVPFVNFEKGAGEAVEEVKGSLTAVDVFASDIASNINDAFSNTLNELVFDFENVGKSIKDILKGIGNSFFQLISTIATNPIRIALSGGGGPGGQSLDIGAGIGSLFGGIKNSFNALGNLVGLGGGINPAVGFLSTLGGAIPAIGIIAGAVAGFASLISGLFKKTPRLDIDFDKLRNDFGKKIGQVAKIGDFFDEELVDNIINISVKRKVGLGLGRDKIKELIADRITGIAGGLQDLINTLPQEIAGSLNELLLNAELDTDTVIGGERFFEFDAKGKKVGKKFQTFIESELPAKFFGAIRESFFEPALQALGVSSEGTQNLIDDFLDKLKNAGSREARGQVGQEFLGDVAAFFEAFNFVTGNFEGSTRRVLSGLESLSAKLGFETVPSIDKLTGGLSRLIENAELDPETIQDFKTLRTAIIQAGQSASSSALSWIDFIESLNQKALQLGGTAIDTSGQLNSTIDSLRALLDQENLSAQEREALLRQLDSAVGTLFDQELKAQQAKIQAQNQALQNQLTAEISANNQKIQLITQRTNADIASLTQLRDFALEFQNVSDSLKGDLQGLFTGPSSILSSFEKLNFIQGEIASAQQKLSQAQGPEERLEAIQKLQALQGDLISLGASAFGTASPEFQAIFRTVADELQSLVDKADAEGLKADDLNDKINILTATLESQVSALRAENERNQGQLSNLGSQQVQQQTIMSSRLLELVEFMQGQAKSLLDEQVAFLQEIGVDTSKLAPLEALGAEQLITLRSIENLLQSLQGFRGGSNGVRDFGSGTAVVLHGREEVLKEGQRSSAGGSSRVDIHHIIEFVGDVTEQSASLQSHAIMRDIANSARDGEIHFAIMEGGQRRR